MQLILCSMKSIDARLNFFSLLESVVEVTVLPLSQYYHFCVQIFTMIVNLWYAQREINWNLFQVSLTVKYVLIAVLKLSYIKLEMQTHKHKYNETDWIAERIKIFMFKSMNMCVSKIETNGNVSSSVKIFKMLRKLLKRRRRRLWWNCLKYGKTVFIGIITSAKMVCTRIYL